MLAPDPAGAPERREMARELEAIEGAPEGVASAGAEELLNSFCAAPDPHGPTPRVLVVAAHPDDEVIGAGARLACLRSVWCLHITDGAPRDGWAAREAGYGDVESYARARRRESLRALRLAGIGAGRAWALGVADQRASYELVGATRGVLGMLREVRPDIVLTHPYEGGHPDHDATSFAAHAACALAGRGGEGGAPVVVEFTSYHGGDGGLVTGRFLGEGEVRVVRLGEAERALKRRLLDCFVTQRRVLEQFAVETESFRVAPRYDFTAPPHPDRLWYEWFDWGITGEEWRRRAAEALRVLGLDGAG